jgi:peptidoglycan/LPS O-acetylase OafA/YrhL
MARANWILAFGTALLAAACVVCEHKITLAASVFGFPLVSLGFGCLVLAALSPGCVLSKMRIPGAATMAQLAFTFYLTHKEVIHLAHRRIAWLGWDTDGAPAFAATFAACLFASVVLHLLVERPFLALRDRLMTHEAEKRESPAGAAHAITLA